MTKVTIPDIIRRRYTKSKELSQDVFDNVEINKNLYRGVLNVDEDYDWEYSLVDPQVFPLVRNYLSRSNPTMSAIKLGNTNKNTMEDKQINQDFLNWEIGELMMTTLYYRMYYSAYLAGRGYIKTGWKFEKAKEITEKDEDGNIIRMKVLKDVVNRATAKFVRFNNILIPDRNIPSLHEQPYIIELIQKNVGEMLDENEKFEGDGEKPFWDKKFIKKIKSSGVTDKLLEYEMDRVTDDDATVDFAFRSANVPLICMQTKDNEIFYMPLEGDDEVINTDKEGRYWHGHYPYVDFSPFPEDDEFYNVSLVDIVGDLQIAATEVLNQTMTNIRNINNDMWVVGTPAAQTPDWQFKKRPDGIIRVMGDTSQVQQIRTQDNTRAAIGMAENLGMKIEKAGGISSLYSSGVGRENINQTARGAQIIDQNIDTNMKMIIDLFGEQVLKRTGEHFLELNAQYVTEEQTFAITGKRNVEELITISQERISANFRVTVDTERLQKQTPASRQASLQNTITVLQGIETQSQGSVIVDVTPAVEALVDATPSMDNVDDVVISIDEKSQRDIKMIERGQLPTIKIKDAHEDLIMAVNVYFGEVDNLPPEVLKILEQYVEKHLKFIQAKQELAMMKQPQMPMGQGANGLQTAMQNPTMGEQQGLPNPTYNLGKIV